MAFAGGSDCWSLIREIIAFVSDKRKPTSWEFKGLLSQGFHSSNSNPCGPGKGSAWTEHRLSFKRFFIGTVILEGHLDLIII